MPTPTRLAVGSTLAAALSAALPALAQTAPPGAGETLRELQQRPDAPRPKVAPGLTVPADADAGADPSQRFLVNAVRISGNQLIPTADLQPLVDGVTGHETSLGELRAAAGRITALYRERGFVVARAFVPAQEIDEGVVAVTVLEGSLHSSTVLNASVVEARVLEGVVAAQGLNGKTIRSKETDRELLLLADLPAVGAVNGILKPGQSVGTSDMFVSVGAGKRYEGEVSVDNYGNRYTGQNRLNGHVNVNSPLRIGDRLSLSGTVTEERLLYGRAAYDLPVASNGLRAGAAVSSSHYELGREFANLDASGTANTAGVYASYPAVRGLNANVWFSGALDYRKLKDEIKSTDTTTDKSADVATLNGYGDLADALAGGGYSTWRATGTLGRLKLDTAAAMTTDQAGPHTAGNYRKLELAASRLQAVTPLTSLYAAVDAQLASRNLDASEKFVIGGIYGVRAYPQGEGAGDSGWLANVELRRDITQGIQGSAFYDIGHVKFNDKPYAATINTQTLKGYGLALAARYEAFNVKATVAMRSGQAAVTAPDKKPRFWLTGGWSF